MLRPTPTDSAPAPSAGAEDPLRQIYDQHARYVWRALRRLGLSAADAEDLTHEVFLIVMRKLGDFEHRSTVRTWLFGIAFRAANDFRRRAHVRREHSTEQPDPGSYPADQIESIDRKRARQTLDRLLAELDPDKRAVFVFYEIEHMTMAEVAEIVGCPVQTAYSRLHAARDAITREAKRMKALEDRA